MLVPNYLLYYLLQRRLHQQTTDFTSVLSLRRPASNQLSSPFTMANQDELSPLSSGDREHSAVEEAPATAAAARQPPRKRRRIVISCTECHRRKQKCDRNLPCTNCVSRNKQDSCRYETGAPTAQAAQQHRAGDDETVGSVAIAASGEPAEHAGDSSHRRGKSRPSKYDMDPKLVASQGGVASVGSLTLPGAGASGGSPVTFGYVGNGASTMGFLKKIDDGQAQGESLSHLAMGRETTAYFGTRERYKSLVRQLPARPYVEKLVDMYFKDSNWQYNVSSDSPRLFSSPERLTRTPGR